MYRLITLFIVVLLFFCTPFFASEANTVSPSINGVNIITGKSEIPETSFIKNEFYTVGKNKVGEVIVELSYGDFRIGRVSQQKVLSDEEPKTLHTVAQFFYFPDYTEVIDGLNHKTLYRFDKSLIASVEQFKGTELYRKERFFWAGSPSKPQLTSRVLEDGQGIIWSCYFFNYNSDGYLINETLAGNLSGENFTPPIIDKNGRAKGGERYSVHYSYSSDGLLLSKREANGSIIDYSYDSSTKQCLSKIQRDAHQELSRYTYQYDDQGFLSKTVVEDGASGRQIFEIQSSHEPSSLGQPLMTQSKFIDLETQQEVLLDKTLYFYDPKGRLIKQEFYDNSDQLRYTVHMEYDSQGQLIKVLDSRGEKAITKEDETSHYRYNLHQQQIALIDKYGNTTEFEYDELGRLIKTIYPEVLNENNQTIRPTITQNYDIANNITSTINPQGYETKQRFTVRAKPFETVHPDGSLEIVHFYLDGTEKEKISANGSKVSFSRDAFGRTLTSTSTTPNGTTLQTLQYTYKGSQMISVTDNENYTLTFSYDGAGRQIASVQVTSNGTKQLKWSYDDSGQKNEIREWFGSGDEDFVKKIYERDQWQQLIQTLLADSSGTIHKKTGATPSNNTPPFHVNKEDTAKNERGQNIKREEIVDGYGVHEIILYDALGRVEKKETFNSLFMKLKETHLRYDASGNKAVERHVVLAKGEPIRDYTLLWRYDAMNRVTDIIEGSGSVEQKNTHYTYTKNGELSETLKPNGVKISYEYDVDGHLVKWQASDSSFSYQYTYDNRHRVTRILDLKNNSTTHRTYDAFNQVVEETLGNNLVFKNQFDLAGRRITLTLPDKSKVHYHYHGALLKAIEKLSTDSISLYEHTYHYNADGKLIKSGLIGDGNAIDYEYDKNGYINNLKSPWWSQSLSEQSFDPYRNLTSDLIEDPNGKQLRHFQYSQDNQLISDGEHEYEYDSLYNRLDGEINHLNQLVHIGETSYLYDENGNRIEKQIGKDRWRYYYDALDRLIRVEKEGIKAIEYTYDAFHRRLSQTSLNWNSDQKTWVPISMDYFLFDGNSEIGRVDQAGHIQELRILGLGKGAEIGSAIAIELQGVIYAPIHDQQGSIRCLIEKNSGTVKEFYRYGSYGEEQIFDEAGVQIEESLISNPWRFSSKRYDPETELIFFGKRYYDPSIGRWLTPDPLFFYDTPNLYAFVKNNPLVHQDLYGLFSIRSIWESISSAGSSVFEFFKSIPHRFVHTLDAILAFPEHITDALSAAGHKWLGIDIFSIFKVDYEKIETGIYGNGEISDKLRVTFINGLFTSHEGLLDNLDLISKTHGGINIHYIFRPTQGWSTDIPQAMFIKLGFATFGYRSAYAYLLAQKWKDLIQEMGGVNGGGIITHYAHSLGGTDTDRARHLLTAEEQRMIRIVTIGSATLVRNEGFASVINYVSLGDFVPMGDIFGQIRNFFDPNSNVSFFGSIRDFPMEHPICCESYRLLIERLGTQFLEDYSSSLR